MNITQAFQEQLDVRIADDVEIRESDHLLGLFARTKISSSTQLLSIPYNALLQAPPSNESDWTALIKHLLNESKGSSIWSKYLLQAPTQPDSLMFWTDEVIQDLQDSNIRNKIGKQGAEEMYRSIETNCTIDKFKRMGSYILAYAIELPSSSEDSDDEEGSMAICPFLDIVTDPSMNHNARLEITSSHVELHATKDIDAGERIILVPDELPNSELLRRFGSIRRENPYDTVDIDASLVTGSAPLNRIDYALDNGLLDDFFELPKSGSIPREMRQVIELLELSDSDFFELGEEELPASKSEVVRDRVRSILETKIARYGSTIEEDESLLSGDLPTRRRLAITIRLSEKRILQTALESLQSWHDPRKRRKV